MKDSIRTSLVSFLVLSLILAAAGYIAAPLMMSLLRTPEDIIGDAVLYLRIYFLGLPFLFMYNILSSVFNSLGKSTIPLLLLIFSSILNIILDIIAVAYMRMGIAGAAWATLISQALSALLSFMILRRTLGRMRGRTSTLFSPELFRSMAGIALPSILQQSTISIGMMLVQSVVNGFGSEVLAGYSAAIRVDNIVTVPISAIGNAMSPYTAQNIGAGKLGRVVDVACFVDLRALFLWQERPDVFENPFAHVAAADILVDDDVAPAYVFGPVTVPEIPGVGGGAVVAASIGGAGEQNGV